MGMEATKLLKMVNIWHLCAKAAYFVFPKSQLQQLLLQQAPKLTGFLEMHTSGEDDCW